MDEERDRSDQPETEPVDEAEALRLILALAEALREEFGVGIDAHPGGEGNESGAVNRAFLAAARRILRMVVTPRDELPLMLSRALRQAARLRLVEHGVDERPAERLLDQEPGLGDRWSAYLALAPAVVIAELLLLDTP